MVDNTELNSGTGGDVISTDDIGGGIKVQRNKIQFGVDGFATDVSDSDPLPIDDAGGSLTVDAPTGTPVNVQIGDGTDQAGVTAAGALTVDGSGVTQPVSAASLPLPSGAATVANQLADGHAVTVDNTSGASAVNIQDGGNSITVDGTVGITDGPSVGSFSTFGHLIVAGQNNAIEVIFYEDTPQNLTTVTVTNSGTAVSNGGGALFSSSTNTNGTSKAVSLVNAHYHAGAEMYSMFTATFTAGVADSYQRIGLYDANDGFFIGYEGTSFGVTTRTGASDVSVAKASFSEDDLTGGGSSLFTRAGTPEAIDLTKLNVFRIRFGWFGSAPVSYEVQAPDGHWVTFHKTLFPNLQIVPSIENADLPMTLDIAKTAADATNLQMQTNCWAAGTTHERSKIDDVITGDSLVMTSKAVIAAFNGTAYGNIQSTAAGNLKISLEEASDGMDIGAGNAGTETLRVSISTDDVNLAAINAGQLPDGHNVTVDNATLTVDGSGVTQPVSAVSLPLPTSAATSANQLADGHNVTIDNAAAGAAVNIQDGGNTITVDNGGSFATQATLQTGSALVADVGLSGARTSGGTTFYKNIDVDQTEDAVKATAGQVYWIHAINLSTAPLYLKFYDDTVATVIVGTTVPDLTFPVPTPGDSNGAGFTLSIPNGIEFGTAITIAATTGLADNDAGPPGDNEVIVNLGFA